MTNIKEHILNLEKRLLHSDVRKNQDLLSELLAEDFEEIGSVGKVSSREEVIDWLINKEINTTWVLSEFRIREIAPDLVLATYRAKKNSQTTSHGSMRSSIWKNYDGCWKMVFHQGTKII